MVLIIPVILTILIRFLASLSTTGRIWGVNHLAYFPLSFSVAHALSILAAFALLIAIGRSGAAEAGAPRAGWFQRLRERLGRRGEVGVASVALLALFVLFTGNTHLLGDGALRLKQMREVSFLDAFRTVVPEPADYLLHYGFDRCVAAPLGLGTLFTFRFLSYAAGLVFFWAAVAIARRLAARGGGAGFILGYILSWGGSLMFFGYAEEYALAAAAMLVFFYFGLEYFEGRRTILPATLAFFGCFFLHNFTIVLLPGLIYAAMAGRRRPLTRALPIVVVTLLVVAGWIAVVVAKRGAGTLLLPAGSSDPHYLLWGRDHLADMLNELLLVSPALLILLTLQKRVRQEDESIRRFFWLAGGSSLLLLALVDPQLGMGRDWDLFSLPLLAFHLALLVGIDRSRLGVAARSAILVLALSSTSVWVLLNHVEARALERCENIVSLEGKRGRYGFAMLGDYYFVHERYADAEEMFRLSLEKQRHHDSYLGLAQAQAELGKEAEAVENLKRTLDLDPANPRALMLLGRYYYGSGRWREAREMFTRLRRTPEGRDDAVLAGMIDQLDAKIAEGERAVPPAP